MNVVVINNTSAISNLQWINVDRHANGLQCKNTRFWGHNTAIFLHWVT